MFAFSPVPLYERTTFRFFGGASIPTTKEFSSSTKLLVQFRKISEKSSPPTNNRRHVLWLYDCNYYKTTILRTHQAPARLSQFINYQTTRKIIGHWNSFVIMAWDRVVHLIKGVYTLDFTSAEI